MSNNEHTHPGGVGVPVYEPARPWRWIHEGDLYTGPTGKGQIFPNVRDYIVYDAGFVKRCIEADGTNFTYKLVDWGFLPVGNANPIIGGCAPHKSDTFRVLIDPSKHPYTLRVDGRLSWGGTDLDSIKVFLGSDYGDSGDVISATYENGRVGEDKIPLILREVDNVTNICSYVAAKGIAKKLPKNGERGIIVVYDDTSEAASICEVIFVLTNVVMAADNPSKQILDIKLKSPFLSPGDDKVLMLPINIPIDDIPLSVEIIYNDGRREMTLDGNRVRLNGLRNSGAHDTFFISSQLGQTLPLQLIYTLAQGESYVGDDLVDGVIWRDYEATTEAVKGAYSLKLFCVPRWLDAGRGYRLEYYLLNLDRGTAILATNYVKPAVNSPTFDPTLYGTRQRLQVNVDASKVSSIYVPHIHSQSFAITLLAPGPDKRANFLIEYQQNQIEFGTDCFAKFHFDNVTFWMLDIRCGAVSKEEWLQRLYRQIYPLYDHRTEDSAPDPTHMEIVTGTKSYIMSVDQWVQPFHIDFEVREAETIQIKWIKRTPTDDLILGITPLVCHQMS